MLFVTIVAIIKKKRHSRKKRVSLSNSSLKKKELGIPTPSLYDLRQQSGSTAPCFISAMESGGQNVIMSTTNPRHTLNTLPTTYRNSNTIPNTSLFEYYGSAWKPEFWAVWDSRSYQDSFLLKVNMLEGWDLHLVYNGHHSGLFMIFEW